VNEPVLAEPVKLLKAVRVVYAGANDAVEANEELVAIEAVEANEELRAFVANDAVPLKEPEIVPLTSSEPEILMLPVTLKLSILAESVKNIGIVYYKY
jgi:hypothetical protein